MDGLLLVKTSGLPRTVPFNLRDGVATIDLDVEDSWAPGVSLQATAFQRPAQVRPIQPLQTEQWLTIEPVGRQLQVEVRLPEKARPNQDVTVTALAREPSGKPVAGRISLWAVDEAVLSLTNYSPPNLVGALLAPNDLRWFTTSRVGDLLRAFVPETGDPYGPLSGSDAAWGMGSGEAGGEGKRGIGDELDVPGKPRRQFFETTPLFLGDAPLHADGSTTVSFRLPDNLTTYRVTAIVSAPLPGAIVPARFGIGTAKMRVALPLQIRPAIPGNLRPGDQAEIAALVDNVAGPAGRVEVKVLALPDGQTTPVALTEASPATADIAEHEQRRFAFKLRGLASGIARLHMDVTLHPQGGGAILSDWVEATIPVQAEPPLFDRVAVHGTSDSEAALAVPVRLPQTTARNQGKVELALSSTLLGSLGGAVKELLSYPYGCVEQTASRLVPLLVLPELAKPNLAAGDTVSAAAAREIQRLVNLRIGDRAWFHYWPEQKQISVFSSYAVLVLALAYRAGHTNIEINNLGFDAALELRWMPEDGISDEGRALAFLADDVVYVMPC
jgi:uncharacterized protein YfaS (alpha-2-macroglobulin family)